MNLRQLGLWVALGAMLLDQASKWLMVHYVMKPPHDISVLPFFDLTLVYNHGVSFGFLSQQSLYGIIGLSVLALGITGLMIYWLFKAETRLGAIGLGLIIGGALGNIIDRIRLGAVVDFLHFHWGQFFFPAFNGADTWITIGAGLVLINELKTAKS